MRMDIPPSCKDEKCGDFGLSVIAPDYAWFVPTLEAAARHMEGHVIICGHCNGEINRELLDRARKREQDEILGVSIEI